MSTYYVPRSGLVAAAVPREACGHTMEWSRVSVGETQILEPDCQDSRPLLAVCP